MTFRLLHTASLVVAAALSVVPLYASAQVDEALKAQIRADLLQDTRSSELASEELEGLVSVLAQEVVQQGNAELYLEDRAQPDYSAEFAETFVESPSGYPAAGVFFGIFALFLALGLFLYWRSHGPTFSGIAAR